MSLVTDVITQCIGVAAASSFAVSGVTLAWGVNRQGSAQDYTVPGILLVLGGSVGTLTYLLLTTPVYTIVGEMLLNTLSWGTILAYKLQLLGTNTRPTPGGAT